MLVSRADEFQKIENSLELYDSTRINSIPSSSCTDRDGERLDSDPRPSRAQAPITSHASSSNSSSRRMKSKLRQITSPPLGSSNVDPEIDGVQNNISITGNRLNFVGGGEDDTDNLSGCLDAEEETKRSAFNSDANELKAHPPGEDSLPVTGKLIKDDDRNFTDDVAAATVAAEMSFNSGDGLKDELSAGDRIYSTDATTASPSEKATLDVSADGSGCTSVDAPARHPADAFQAGDGALPSPGSAPVGKCPAGAEERVVDVSASRRSPDDRVAGSGPQLSVSRSFSFNVSNEHVGNHSRLVEEDFYRSLGDCETVTWQQLATDSNSLDVDSFTSEDVTLDSLMGRLAAMLFRKVSIVQSFF